MGGEAAVPEVAVNPAATPGSILGEVAGISDDADEPADTAVAGAADAPEGDLPLTGAELPAILLLGMLMLGSGLLLQRRTPLATRRRRTDA